MNTESAPNINSRRKNSPVFGILGFGLPIIALMALAYLSTNVDKAEQDATTWVSHTQKVQADLSQVLSLLQDMETGQRGYILTNNIKYLEPFDSASKRLDSDILDLRVLTSDNPKQRDRFKMLKALVDDKKFELLTTIDLRRERGFKAALTMVETDSGKIIMDKIRAVVKKMSDEEAALLITRQSEVKALRSMTKNLYAAVIVLITIFSATLLYRLHLAKKNAQSAIRAEFELLASKCQELQIPLMASMGSLDLLRLMKSSDLSEEGRNLVESIKRNNDASLRLTNELLDPQKDGEKPL